MASGNNESGPQRLASAMSAGIGRYPWQCGKWDEPMATAELSSSPHVHFVALLGASRDHQPTCPLTVNQQDVEALLYSGSARTLVRESVLETPSVWFVCNVEYLTTMVKLTTTKGVSKVVMGAIKDIAIPVLIGHNCRPSRCCGGKPKRGSNGGHENIS